MSLSNAPSRDTVKKVGDKVNSDLNELKEDGKGGAEAE